MSTYNDLSGSNYSDDDSDDDSPKIRFLEHQQYIFKNNDLFLQFIKYVSNKHKTCGYNHETIVQEFIDEISHTS